MTYKDTCDMYCILILEERLEVRNEEIVGSDCP